MSGSGVSNRVIAFTSGILVAAILLVSGTIVVTSAIHRGEVKSRTCAARFGKLEPHERLPHVAGFDQGIQDERA